MAFIERTLREVHPSPTMSVEGAPPVAA